MKKLLLLLLFVLPGIVSGQDKPESQFVKGHLIVKLNPRHRNVFNRPGENAWMKAWKKSYPSLEFQKKFPHHKSIKEQYTEDGKPLVDLSLIYDCRVSKDSRLRQLKTQLLRSGFFEYVEFIYPVELFAKQITPSDPELSKQYYLESINAYRAWGKQRGDSSVILGLSDTGTDVDHPDLVNKIAYNHNDTIDGVDNDNDGYVDNYRGWDLGEMDNDPNVNKIGHGSHVSGILSADTDNGQGVAGVGFDLKYLPVKVDDEYGSLTMSYESIIYAADHGASVINCSWGGSQGAGKYGQDVVNYATFNRDALVVAACGNSDSEDEKFPAAYENVISVAATNHKDFKAFFSTYNYSVDVSAPGRKIYNTWANGNYVYFNGTSMASPMVAAAAGLVRSEFPFLNARQTGEQVRMHTREVYNNYVNAKYSDQLGTGILDMYAAVNSIDKPSVKVSRLTWKQKGNVKSAYDTVNLSGTFTNYLHQTPLNAEVKLRCNHPLIQVLDSSFSIGAMNTMAERNNHNQPFSFMILPGMPMAERVFFKLVYDYGSFADYQYVSQSLNRAYITMNTGAYKLTINSSGRIGYNDDYYKQGIGLKINSLNRSMITTGGLLLGVNNSKVSDAIYGENGFDNDFKPLDQLKKKDSVDEFYYQRQYSGTFNDDAAGTLKTGLSVVQNVLDWEGQDHDNYLIHEFIIYNPTSSVINNIYSGYYIDWDIHYSHKNRAEWNSATQTAYAYDTDGYGYGGIKVLKADTQVFHYALDNDGSDNSVEINDGFAGYEKWQVMQSSRDKAGFGLSKGNDISHMVSSGPYSLAPGDSLTIAYAVLAGDHKLAVDNAANAAWDKYYNVVGVSGQQQKGQIQVFPNPAENAVNIHCDRSQPWKIELYSMDGRKVMSRSFQGNSYRLDIPEGLQGMYLLSLRNKDSLMQKKILIR